MNIIIDTHIFLWALSNPKRIDPHRRDELQTPTNTIFVSSISIAEIAIKASLGKLSAKFDAVKMIEMCGFEQLDFRCEDAALLRDLPVHHKDPFDRMLIVQSILNQYPIMTDDAKFGKYDCTII
jgi:PIN domain nuclease of toxin-antitoxin system